MLRVKASPSSSKHIRTEDGSWRETDITTDSKRATVRRQNFASENESFSQFEDGVNPVHRTSPMVRLISHLLM